ncbi:hypothetical protein [Amycolatopsis sp. CA-230715]|uniref:hypothetical protein n=1 Tax=Amycolatopsis sp. CA-230715 TaxID=2745196 RepID=UPI001C0163F0|nr:hypothetical protein [Amycolatopsis sp. CA-230715]QWF85400.1 hypothetical protein HUW46_08854 [Amycolatopsis sp. CA-230715]
MPALVVSASVLQFLLAMTFAVIPVAALRHGAAAQRAAEAEVTGQGFAARVLAEHQVRFAETGKEALFPFALAALLTALGAMNLAGIGVGRIASFVVAAILMTAGGFVTAGQVFAARSVESAFRKSRDAAARAVDGRAVVAAAAREFPYWLRPLQVVRFALTTLGSVLVIALLAAAGSYFG